MEWSIIVWFRPSKKHPASRGSRFRRWSVSREPHALNPKLDWIHSVIVKAVLSLALTAVWKLSYAMKGGFLPIACEKSGLAPPGLPAGFNRGIFIGFFGKWVNGTGNEENAVVYCEPLTGRYLHFVENSQPDVGHLDGLLA